MTFLAIALLSVVVLVLYKFKSSNRLISKNLKPYGSTKNLRSKKCKVDRGLILVTYLKDAEDLRWYHIQKLDLQGYPLPQKHASYFEPAFIPFDDKVNELL